MCSQNGNTQLPPPPLNCMAGAALLQLLDFSLGRDPWERRKLRAVPNTMQECYVPPSLLGGLCCIPVLTTHPVLSLSLQKPSHAGTKADSHLIGAAPGDSNGGLGGDLACPQQVWFGRLEGSSHGRGLCSMHVCLHAWDALHPFSA